MGFQPMSCRAILALRPGRGKMPRRRTDKMSVPRTTRTPHVRFFSLSVVCASVCRELLLLFWNLGIGICLELVSWDLRFAVWDLPTRLEVKNDVIETQ